MAKVFVYVFLACLIEYSVSNPVVDTIPGKVRGKTIALDDGTDINRFHGVPFSKAPVGPLRFMPPEDVVPWQGEYDANELRSCCPQGSGAFFLFTHPFWNKFSEDCLYMNIYAPADTSGGPYPVMIFYHGGGYISGCNIQYSLHFLAAKGIVVVVPNYRIGAMGFMTSGDSVAPGNYGLMDQIKVMEYVRDNIAAYGGDPNQVTISGQSAGASSSGIHMISPGARGLFHRAILMSGSDMAVWAINEPSQQPETYTQQAAEQLDCPIDDSQKMFDCLREVDSDLLWRSGFTCTPGYFCQGHAPVVDGPGGVIPELPYSFRLRGEFDPVPTLAGQLADDGSLYTVFLIPESLEGGFNRSAFEYHLMKDLVGIFAPALENQQRIDGTFEALNWFYSQWPHIDDDDANREAFNVLITDFGFGFTGNEQIKSQSAYQEDVYYYLFDYRSKALGFFLPEWMGVPHSAELPYITGWALLRDNPQVRRDSEIISPFPWGEEDQKWTHYILELWANFIKTSNPTPAPVESPVEGLETRWPKFNTDTWEYLYMSNEWTGTASEYRQTNHAFWLQYLTYVANYTFFPSVPQSSSHPVKPVKLDTTPKTTEPRVFASGEFQEFLNVIYQDIFVKSLNQKRHPGN